ncbi:MAG: AsmA-like C-terminal region-containing protein [Bacteroidota bacterium]|nr:AsmA-like C-terminal region-containing protein [Bacteroidota bacterium]
MKIVKKVLIIFGIIILLVIIAGIIIPFVYKDKIIEKAKTEVNANLNAKVNWKDFSLSVFKSFPDITLSVNDLSIVGVNEFNGDTLTGVKNFNITLDIMSVIKGEKMEIKIIELENPRIFAKVLKDGKASWDITKPSADTTKKAPSKPVSFKLSLKGFIIDNAYIVYEDDTKNLKLLMKNVNHKLKGDFTQDNFTMTTKTMIDELSCSYGGVKYLSKVKTDLKMDLDMDMKNMKFTFNKNELVMNDLTLSFDGFISMPKEDIVMDFKYGLKKTEFKNIMSMIPAVYTKDFDKVKSSGRLALDGFVKGTYNDKSLPGYGVNMLIENGMFQYPSLPTAVKNVQLNLKVNNNDGVTDHTVINLSKLHFELGQDQFDAKLNVKTPVSDAQIDAIFKGRVNLAEISRFVPLEAGTKISGLLTTDITAKGRMSSIDKKRYEEFDAKGNLKITNLYYASKEMPVPTDVKEINLTFNPKNVTLNNFESKIGKTDIKANGTLDNFIAYAVRNETIKGKLNLVSNYMDINEFMGSENASAKQANVKDTSHLTLIEIPGNVDFEMNASIKKLLYDKIDISNVKGNLIVRDRKVDLKDLKMNLLDGSLGLNGSYDTKVPKKAKVDMNFNITDFDIKKTFMAFVTMKKLAPIANSCKGKFTCNLSMKTDLDKKMEPVLNTLNGGGKLQTKSVIIESSETMNKIAGALKMDKYRNPELKNLNISFKFADGKVNVEPFNTSIAGTKATISGYNGFDQTLAYKIGFEIPKSEFGKQANDVLNNMVAKANSKGANFSVGSMVKVDALVSGTVTNPKVSVNLKGAAENVAEDLKSKAKEELSKKKAELEAKAKAEIDKAKKTAEQKINAEKEKAKAEADRLKKEAEDKAKAAAEKAKKDAQDKVKNAAKEKLKKFF